MKAEPNLKALAVSVIAWVVTVTPLLAYHELKKPQVAAASKHLGYTVELLTEPDMFLFRAPQECSIVLRKGIWQVCKVDTVIANDGGSIGRGSWNVKWDDEGVTVVVSGEEMADKGYYLWYGGDWSYVKVSREKKA